MYNQVLIYTIEIILLLKKYQLNYLNGEKYQLNYFDG